MKSIDYITVRVGLKFIVLFEDDFINHNVEQTIKYLHNFLYTLYPEGTEIEVMYHCHDFIGDIDEL